MNTYFRVHPNINMARVGSSDEYYIAPETAAGELLNSAGEFGGLPTKAGSENTSIQESDFRDEQGNPKRQAARFRLYAYDVQQSTYPSEDRGREIKVGDVIEGKTIKDIIWQVHLANKKNNTYQITGINNNNEPGEYGIDSYNGTYPLPPIRNADQGGDLSATNRRTQLVIDAGPRALAVAGAGSQVIHFNAVTNASYVDNSGQIQTQPNYPVSFPSDHFKMLDALGPIDTLGEMLVEQSTGRLIVVGGYGKASAILDAEGNPPNLCDPIDNDGWFDDTCDGPVRATIVFDDNSTVEAIHGWVVCTDPGYAPQTRNVVSTWDDMYSTWVEELNLVPGLYNDGSYQAGYRAAFDQDVQPIFHGALLQQWNTNLPQKAIAGHGHMAKIKPSDDPKSKLPSLTDLIRDPNKPNEDGQGKKMPLSLGDATKSFLSLSKTQYFLLNQWYEGCSVKKGKPLGVGEKMDRATMENCLGGRYSPGIDLTFIVRDKNLYVQKWQGQMGPFRVNIQKLDYANAVKDQPFLDVGYIPVPAGSPVAKVEPGDLCKFMSQPWHTDYNSCGTHTPDPNPAGNNTLYWSWPSQRPVVVYPKSECTYDSENNVWRLGGQLYSVRGDEGVGTETPYPQQQGRFQCYFDYVMNWHRVGFVIQGTQIPSEQGGNYGADKFLVVSSLFTGNSDRVTPWPQATVPGYTPPDECGPPNSPACPRSES